MLQFDENDHSLVYHELYDIECQSVALESAIGELNRITLQISTEGIDVTTASTIMAMGDDIIPKRYPLNSFTSARSRTNLVPSMEGMLDKAKEFIWMVLESVADFLTKVKDWFMARINGSKTATDLNKTNEAWKKSVEERISALEKRLAELDRDKDLNPIEKAKAKQDLSEMAAADERTRANEKYTVLAKVALNNPDKIKLMMDTLISFPALKDTVDSTIRAIDATLKAYDDNPNLESLLSSLGATNDLSLRFSNRLNEICAKLLRCRLPDIDFGNYDTSAPDEYITNIRTAMLSASRTPVGIPFAVDYKPGRVEAYKTMASITEAILRVQKYLDATSKLPAEITELTKRLRASIKRIRSLRVELTADQIDVRNRLLESVKLLRRSLVAYMRLRELPLCIIDALYEFADVEKNFEDVLKSKFKK